MSISGHAAANGECPGKADSEPEIINSCDMLKGDDTGFCEGSTCIVNFISVKDSSLKERSDNVRNAGYKRVRESVKAVLIFLR